ncbi:Casein kinase I isoform beta [Orchesella cincta]|uniref:non-specific serine/threonine protein kinase n=1 Tax=Orchesella cincta TaxID=48709 RepID=A0A1D2MJS7_ORCCI|nr:Casein kinase I isoform beta [Orchesella cincta]
MGFSLESFILGGGGQVLVGERYRLMKKIGTGAFSEVWLAKDITNAEEVALKLERSKTFDHDSTVKLGIEKEVYQSLNGAIGIPQAYWFGKLELKDYHYNVMALERLGVSLGELIRRCGGFFSLKTTLMLADQLIQRIEMVHSQSYIHRDIKMDNILMGLGSNSNILYIIDFGLALRYRHPETGVHIDLTKGIPMGGTPLFAPLSAHLGFGQSRKDDLESVGYLLVYLINGTLPWGRIKAAKRAEVFQRVKQLKLTTSVEKLCKGLPSAFKQYFWYCQALRFEDNPDYNHLREIFSKLFTKRGYQNDNRFDWVVLAEKKELAQRTRRQVECPPSRMDSPSDPLTPETPVMVGEEYQLIRKLGAGSCGEVWLARNITNGEERAFKMEEMDYESYNHNLQSEFEIYQVLHGGFGIAKVYSYAEEQVAGHLLNVMGLEPLGPDLYELFMKCGGSFSLKTTLMLAEQMLNRVEFVHSKGYIHRDIKLENFVMGLGPSSSKLYLVDFSVAFQYIDPVTNQHKRQRNIGELVGNAHFSSLAAHQGWEQSRKDDLESIGLVLVLLLHGSLPWVFIEDEDYDVKASKIRMSIESTSIDELCQGLPSAFKTFLMYSRNLGFRVTPDYEYLRGIFKNCFRKRGFKNDLVFDWMTLDRKNASAQDQPRDSRRKSKCVIT